MKKTLIVLLLMLIPVMVFAVDFSYSGHFRTRGSQLTDPYLDNLAHGYEDIISWTDYQLHLFTTAAINENLSMVWGVEVNGIWGNEDQNRDEITVMTKHLYMDFAPEMADWMHIRLGLQPYRDIFTSSIFDDDAVGVSLMPEWETADVSLGYYVFHDEEIAGLSNRFWTLDVSKSMNALTLKAAALMNKVYEAGALDNYSRLYIGAAADYAMETMDFGGHFVYSTTSFDEEDGNPDMSGYFAYLYGKMDVTEKLSVKLNFGYTPGNLDFDNGSLSITTFEGISPYFNPYGLEYLFVGSVMDFPVGNGSVFNTAGNTFGFYNGLMVFSANITYDIFYLNAGFVNMVFDIENSPVPIPDFETNIGTEIDLGIKTQLTDGLDFCAVYALFMPGSFFEDEAWWGTDTDPKTVHEISAKLQYNF